MSSAVLPVAVLASGEGSNLQALIDAARRPDAGFEIACVASDRAGARALERASAAGIPAYAVDPQGRDRDAFDAEVERRLHEHGVALVALAGFMRILSSGFVQRWRGKLLNIHPSLLPKHRGLDTHRRALAAGDETHGASVHFVTEELDSGPVILQAVVPVYDADDAASLAARVQALEHRVYPFAVSLYAHGRIAMDGDGVTLDGRPLERPLHVETGTDLTCVA